MILGIYGAGGLGREVLELAKQIESVEKKWSEILFVADLRETFNEVKEVNGKKVIDFEVAMQRFKSDEIQFVVAVGEPAVRRLLFEKIKTRGYFCSTLIHPDVHIPETTELAEGVVVQTQAVISCNVKIGENTFIQNTATVGHDTIIGKHDVISANTAIAGHCMIGDQVYIALNVPVKEETRIGDNSIIGMGAVVLRDIPENVIAMGNPARPIKNKNDSKVFKNRE